MSRHIKCSPGCCPSNPIVIGDCGCDSHLRLRAVDTISAMPGGEHLSDGTGSFDEINVGLVDLRSSVDRSLSNCSGRRRRSGRRSKKAASKGFAYGALTMIRAGHSSRSRRPR